MDETPTQLSLSDEDRLTKSLEKAASKLEGHKREHFTDARSLCTTCRWAHITRRDSKNSRTIRCTSLGEFMPEDIVECSEYSNITQLSLDQMARIAYLIDPRDGMKGGYL